MKNKIYRLESFAVLLVLYKDQEERVLIDYDDIEKVSQKRWYLTTNGYVMHSVSRSEKLYLHKYVSGIKDMCDHINGDRLDCRKKNLRPATPSQNSANKGRHKSTSAIYPGVYWREDCRKYRAKIRVDSKQINLGHFATAEEAIEAKKEAETKYFGEFAPHLSREG